MLILNYYYRVCSANTSKLLHTTQCFVKFSVCVCKFTCVCFDNFVVVEHTDTFCKW